MRSRTEPVAGSLLAGRYRLSEPLTPVGAGAAYRAHDEVADRPVTIEAVGLGSGEESMTAVRRQAGAAARLTHPGMARVLDLVEHDDSPWVVTEFIAAPTLEQLVAESGPLDERDAALLGVEILETLAAALAGGVEVRDLRPSTILVTGDGRAVLTGIGVRHAPDSDDPYVSPETARGRRADGLRSDLWSLGATLYAAVHGAPPGPNGSAPDTALDPVLAGLLAPDPAQRPSPEATDELLRNVAEGIPVPTTPPRAQPTDPTRDHVRDEPPADPSEQQPTASAEGRPAAAATDRPVEQPVEGKRASTAEQPANPVGTPVTEAAQDRSAAGVEAVRGRSTGAAEASSAEAGEPVEDRAVEARVQPPLPPPAITPPLPPPVPEPDLAGERPAGAPADDDLAAALAAFDAALSDIRPERPPKPTEPAPHVGAVAALPTTEAADDAQPVADRTTKAEPAATAQAPTEPTDVQPPTTGADPVAAAQAPTEPTDIQPPTTGADPAAVAQAPTEPTNVPALSTTDAGQAPTAAPDVQPADRSADVGSAAAARTPTAPTDDQPAERTGDVEPAAAAAVSTGPPDVQPERTGNVEPAAAAHVLAGRRDDQPAERTSDVEPAAAAHVLAVPPEIQPAERTSGIEPAAAAHVLAGPPDVQPDRTGRVEPAAAARVLAGPAQVQPDRTAEPAGPAEPPRSAARQRRGLFVAAAALVLLALVGGLIVIAGGGEDQAAAPPQPTATASPPANGGAPPGPQTPSPRAPAPPPDGWQLSREAGYYVAIPIGWRRTAEGSIVTWQDPDSNRVVRVQEIPPTNADPYDFWLGRAARTAIDIDGYDFRRIGTVLYRGWPTADWHYSAGTGPERVHVVNRLVEPGTGKAYIIAFSTSDSRWEADKTFYDTVTATFGLG